VANEDEMMRDAMCDCSGERVRSEDAEKSGGSSKQWCTQGGRVRGEGVFTYR
jgi:hypothetical protein